MTQERNKGSFQGSSCKSGPETKPPRLTGEDGESTSMVPGSFARFDCLKISRETFTVVGGCMKM